MVMQKDPKKWINCLCITIFVLVSICLAVVHPTAVAKNDVSVSLCRISFPVILTTCHGTPAPPYKTVKNTDGTYFVPGTNLRRKATLSLLLKAVWPPGRFLSTVPFELSVCFHLLRNFQRRLYNPPVEIITKNCSGMLIRNRIQ